MPDSEFFSVGNPLSIFRSLIESIPCHPHYKEELEKSYGSAGRYYHGVFHLAQMWSIHEKLSVERKQYLGKQGKIFNNEKDDLLIKSAILFHDAILDPRLNNNGTALKSNEAYSAAMAVNAVKLDHEERVTLSSMIQATANHFVAGDVQEHDREICDWFVGLDLASLAVPWDDFRRNTMAIRAEYAHLNDEDWLKGRGAFLKMIQDHIDAGGYIYRHPIMREEFEKDARENIKRSIHLTAAI